MAEVPREVYILDTVSGEIYLGRHRNLADVYWLEADGGSGVRFPMTEDTLRNACQAGELHICGSLAEAREMRGKA